MEQSDIEKSLIALAEQELDCITLTGQEGRSEAALQHYHAVMTLVRLTEFDNSGLSISAAQVLQRIGVDAAKAATEIGQ
ncbi:hypothetical protein [Pseudomonas sp. MWU12-2323]|uniref:hypothetical protein n=1 Tax=Pseudomonas sp. MWU12-2323 TaxID=2651296 RepID=UPI00128B2879|nr:hypothetical protein [Pseudomonas sp. MWU12-2323]MPQ71468.1 hypothetical protein [Pseudomonas sp. MWU12-2323]